MPLFALVTHAGAKQLSNGNVLQAPPCDLPLVATSDRRQSGRGRSKAGAGQRKLDAAHSLNLQQYAKRRHAMPQEVCSSAEFLMEFNAVRHTSQHWMWALP